MIVVVFVVFVVFVLLAVVANAIQEFVALHCVVLALQLIASGCDSVMRMWFVENRLVHLLSTSEARTACAFGLITNCCR